MSSFVLERGRWLAKVPLLTMGSLDLASATYAYWMLRITVQGEAGWWASQAEPAPGDPLALATVARRGGVSSRALARALAPYVEAHWQGRDGAAAFEVALSAIRRGRAALLRLPSASPVFPEGHHVVVRGHGRIVAGRLDEEQLIVADPAIGERLLSQDELAACRSREPRNFHVFVARGEGEPARAARIAPRTKRSR
jgi:hypothetical protein